LCRTIASVARRPMSCGRETVAGQMGESAMPHTTSQAGSDEVGKIESGSVMRRESGLAGDVFEGAGRRRGGAQCDGRRWVGVGELAPGRGVATGY
jgi:hypothetical protein